jgi:hypothetical protein
MGCFNYSSEEWGDDPAPHVSAAWRIGTETPSVTVGAFTIMSSFIIWDPVDTPTVGMH